MDQSPETRAADIEQMKKDAMLGVAADQPAETRAANIEQMKKDAMLGVAADQPAETRAANIEQMKKDAMLGVAPSLTREESLLHSIHRAHQHINYLHRTTLNAQKERRIRNHAGIGQVVQMIHAKLIVLWRNETELQRITQNKAPFPSIYEKAFHTFQEVLSILELHDMEFASIKDWSVEQWDDFYS